MQEDYSVHRQSNKQMLNFQRCSIGEILTVLADDPAAEDDIANNGQEDLVMK